MSTVLATVEAVVDGAAGCKRARAEPQSQQLEPSARERVLADPNLLEGVFFMLGRPLSDLVDNISGVCRLWRDVLRGPSVWQHMLGSTPARKYDQENAFTFVKGYVGASTRTPVVYDEDWLANVFLYFELWEINTGGTCLVCESGPARLDGGDLMLVLHPVGE